MGRGRRARPRGDRRDRDRRLGDRDPGLDEIQRQNRGVVAIGVFGTGLTGAGLLAGVGALLRLKVAEARRGQG